MSDRPYRRGQPFEVARDVIATESAKQFDPEIVQAFLSVREETWKKARDDADRGCAVAEDSFVAESHGSSPDDSFRRREAYHVLSSL